MYHALEQNETDHYQETQCAEMIYWVGREQAAKTKPIEIILAQFMDALSVMPPLDWQGNHKTESFKLQEMIIGNVTDLFVKVDECYFTRKLCRVYLGLGCWCNNEKSRLSPA
ncbi:TPA: hypothetical protein ACS78C_003678 [Providencia alcalifaciens]